MKTITTITVIILLHLNSFSQGLVTLSGGSSFGAIEGGSPKVKGYKISGSYDYMFDPHWSMGASLSFIEVTETEGILDTRFRARPLLFIPKYFFGEEKLKGYVKGALGVQRSRFKSTGGPLSAEDWDVGLTFGGGVGVNYTLSEQLFLNLDYEYLWIKNSSYKEVSLNSISLGIGFIFPD